jgi:hypothetical protein
MQPTGSEVCMKKFLIAALIFTAAILPAHSLSFYFDAGIGVGPAWTSLNEKDFINDYNDGRRFDEIAIDLGLKLGAGPLGSMPVYIVGVLNGMGHRITDKDDVHVQFGAYLIGPGLIIYPTPFFQIAASLGYSFVGNDCSIENAIITNTNIFIEDKSKGCLAWDISIAADSGIGNHALMLGLRFFNAVNTLKRSGVEQKNLMVSIFARYAFREKHR